MQHLDEGLLMALLDGELTGVELQEAEIHLRACSECGGRLAELKGFMVEADSLVADLGDPPAQTTTVAPPPRHRPRPVFAPRTLAWAASIVAALGLGFAGSQWMSKSGFAGEDYAAEPQERSRAADTASLPAPSPTSVGPEIALQEERRGQTAGAALQGEPGAGDEARPPELSSASSRVSEGITIQPNAAEVGQANQAREQDAADAASNRDTAAPSTAAAAKLADLSRRLESHAERQLAAPATAPSAGSAGVRFRGNRSVQAFQPTSMEEAVRHLSGAIRLIDGFTPEEFEVAASDSAQPLVRVIYRIGPAETRLFLEQRRVDNSFVASDLQTLQPAEGAAGNVKRLSWNDLRGFSLTLVGPFSVDSLFHFKTLVK